MIISVLCIVTAASPPASADGDVFAGLGPQEKIELLSVILEKREHELANFEYQMVETIQLIDPHHNNGAKQFLKRSEMGLKRIDDQYRLSAEVSNEKGEVYRAYASHWSGKELRSLTTGIDLSHPNGRIDDQQRSKIWQNRLNLLLGFREAQTRVMSGSRVVVQATVSSWLKDSRLAGDRVSIDIIDRDGVQLVRLRTDLAANSDRKTKFKELIFDPARGYLVIEYRSEFQSLVGKSYSKELVRLEEAKKIDGVWVPVRAVMTIDNSAAPGWAESVYEVTAFSLNTVTDDDLKVEFPPGTEVVNSYAKVAYRVLEGGDIEMIPLVDSDTGKVIDPQIASVAEVTSATDVVSSAESAPRASAAPSPPLASQSDANGISPVLMIAAGVVICIIGLILIRARRGAAA